MEKVIALLGEYGYTSAGATATESVRIPTMRAPVFGGIGGELRTLGGRQRFAKGAKRVTVGKITTCFYEVDAEKKAAELKNFRTKDLDAIRLELEGAE